ncbi:MAG: sulfatase-like hydrolase/transferase [Phenylobacterium sp.]|uniref:sulfatase-like hydrolase/transferase n=1 Tax=Phenylobacterium sp. TaxID=1871053 RepID=UPI0025F31C9D|nr:sulfatase-like hydrolase/transferase [Phenylobacterium sp.]MBI1197959.1 sulfatase-like hydrolase/transferase [Phenylobacterium sp.]
MTWRNRLRGIAIAVLATAMAAPVAGARDRTPAAPEGDDRPNIIILLADDLGYGDLGVQGGRDVATPNIDRLAAQGVRLTDYYANHPVCAPSRAALMTGRYQQRFGFENNPGLAQRTATDFGLPRDEPTLPERLKARGYATAMNGKWHIGFTETNVPTARGFDAFYGFLDGAMAYIPDGKTGAKAMLRGTSPAPMPAHTTEAFADEAVAFIEAHKDRPFFIYESFNAVHAPLQSTDRYLARYADVKDPSRRTYLAMLAALDDAVGKIVDTVDREGLGRRTLIVFASDNGGPTWQTTSANGPLAGVKGLTLEGGIRTPAIFRWTGRLPQARTIPTVAMEFDVTATALKAAGASMEGLDGVDLTPFLTGAKAGDAHDRLYWRAGPLGAMREGRWKLVKAEDAYFLFDLRSDIGERHDLASADPKRLERMKSEWGAWSASMAPPRWGPLNRTASAKPGAVRGLVEDYIARRPVDAKALLYGGGPE